jgi:hydrogenase-4 membrane subunit HyfE
MPHKGPSMRITQPLYDRVTLGIALLGLAVFVWGYFVEDSDRALLRIAAGILLLAYFAILVENFLSRRAVHTRQGILESSDGLLRYSLPYVALALFGVVFALIVFTS